MKPKTLKILKTPDPKLKAPNYDIAYVVDYKELVLDMIKTLHHHSALGLAAPQIGYNVRLFISKVNKIPTVFVNSVITSRSAEQVTIHESCLSEDGVIASIPRSKDIEVEYLDINGKKKTMSLTGMNSIIFQHEYDHINPEGGILLTDYMEKENDGKEEDRQTEYK